MKKSFSTILSLLLISCLVYAFNPPSSEILDSLYGDINLRRLCKTLKFYFSDTDIKDESLWTCFHVEGMRERGFSKTAVLMLAVSSLVTRRYSLYHRFLGITRSEEFGYRTSGDGTAIEVFMFLRVCSYPNLAADVLESSEFRDLLNVSIANIPVAVLIAHIYGTTLNLSCIRFLESSFPLSRFDHFRLQDLNLVYLQFDLSVEDVRPAVQHYKAQGYDFDDILDGERNFYPELVAMLSEAYT